MTHARSTHKPRGIATYTKPICFSIFSVLAKDQSAPGECINAKLDIVFNDDICNKSVTGAASSAVIDKSLFVH